ncbi:MAG: tRNA (adenosine(37)-N6)-threonylcarbamoyltransferase complex dimerization subunit type 1 TsaB [Actinobacteria bacterium]|nr:tRNA (adenosine(37)-N6)-threonylcarbamoyltransferase complex dimerization subunit type 1 TsaB [Cyanobacteriota bacterium]MCL5771020.1 tRNA (adenosine(37)-N6)-threonylcarbamoyltransferase complex dimerization subunit type 1 TsaB [Actinomycetota bacterium]
MSTILAIDSTTELLSISVSENGIILSELKDDKSRKHMVNIINDIDTTLKKAKKTIKDIDLFSVNLGPGDFTGGRIGISVVKIFSMLSDKPVFGFNCLDIFSVGCAITNIEAIKNVKKKSNNTINNINNNVNNNSSDEVNSSFNDNDYFNNNGNKNNENDGSVYIMPLKDVRNDEIYFSIYEVRNLTTKNDSDNLIFKFDYDNTQYYIYKKFGNFLIKSGEASKKLIQVINQLINFKNFSCSTCGKIFNKNEDDRDVINNDFYDINNINEKNVDDNFKRNLNKEEFKGKFKIIFTADAVKNYKELLQNISLNIRILDKKTNVTVDIDENNLNPSSRYLNFLAYFNFTSNLKSLPIAPVYVRNFITFGKK